jgi:oligoendopeptidase F
MQAEADLFVEANLPLLGEEKKLSNQYESLVGAQTVQWEGEEVTVTQLSPVFRDPDRDRRERAYRLGAERQMADLPKLDRLWTELYDLRARIADNAGRPDFREYMWRKLKRFDYTPEDCFTFHDAVEEVFVPLASRIYAERQAALGVESLRPWDTLVDPQSRPPLSPYQSTDEYMERTGAIFERVDPALKAHYDRMRHAGLLDLENRKNKAPSAYSTSFDAQRVAFIFENAVGLHEDVMTLLHEAGHAFHTFESAHWPYHQQRGMNSLGMEVAEVASMAMEQLGAPYLRRSEGGFYDEADYARARLEHLEEMVLWLPYMAMIDALQHWVYTHPEGRDPAACTEVFSALWERFRPGIDFTGLEDYRDRRWQRQIHVYTDPFYYVEYGMAQVGALQIRANALEDQARAVAAYRRALALGGTATIPEFYEAASVRFAFDVDTLRSCADLIERELAQLKGAKSP